MLGHTRQCFVLLYYIHFGLRFVGAVTVTTKSYQNSCISVSTMAAQYMHLLYRAAAPDEGPPDVDVGPPAAAGAAVGPEDPPPPEERGALVGPAPDEETIALAQLKSTRALVAKSLRSITTVAIQRTQEQSRKKAKTASGHLYSALDVIDNMIADAE
jgi:hypothetical protein